LSRLNKCSQSANLQIMVQEDTDKPVTSGILNEAIDTLLKGMDNLYERLKGEVDGLKIEMNSRFASIDKRFDNLEAKVDLIKNELVDEIGGLKAELSTTPSRTEFEELKTRVNKHRYPLS
jgi:hypothetical protein